MLRGWAWEECLVKGLRCHEVVGGVWDHVFGGGVHVWGVLGIKTVHCTHYRAVRSVLIWC